MRPARLPVHFDFKIRNEIMHQHMKLHVYMLDVIYRHIQVNAGKTNTDIAQHVVYCMCLRTC